MTNGSPLAELGETIMISARKIIRALCLVPGSLVLSAFAAPAGEFGGAHTAPVAAAREVPISLNFANSTSSDISNAAIGLHEPAAGRVTYLNGLSLQAGAETQVRGSFTVPQGLYKSRQKEVLRP